MNTVISKYHHTQENILHEETEIKAAIHDISKFSVLYDRYYIPIFRFIHQRTDTENTATDLTSQVFLKAMTYLDKYQFRGLPFASWLYRVAANEINQEHRKNRIERVFNTSTESLHQIAEEIESNEDDRVSLVLNALNILNADEMCMVEMRYFEQRHFREISEILEADENVLRVKMHRIIQKLKKHIFKK